jgi:NADPH:quinone reductase-like Zn-dependent oxidoreductase
LVLFSGQPPINEKADIIRQFDTTVMPLFATGFIESLIGASYPLSKPSKAHQLMEKGGHFGKIVLLP